MTKFEQELLLHLYKYKDRMEYVYITPLLKKYQFNSDEQDMSESIFKAIRELKDDDIIVMSEVTEGIFIGFWRMMEIDKTPIDIRLSRKGVGFVETHFSLEDLGLEIHAGKVNNRIKTMLKMIQLNIDRKDLITGVLIIVVCSAAVAIFKWIF